MEHVVAAVDHIKEGATAMMDRLGRATQKKLHDEQPPTGTAWGEVRSKAKNLPSKGVTQVGRYPLITVVQTFGAVVLVNFIFFLMRMMHR